ncbi:hypothetical protein [Lachnotalea glycerini]|uniref:ATP-binding cassette domain-containing protein n=1 Tax=Lachnotalea glycerini TaxID=1763509 RepID=A0A371JCV3_9FIRM|nr:hypothetical protein [Lachnotalea glycerini]RDY30594.1 hypothetical protein CG710_014040 [Lachnotalea glycerini]
MLLSGQNIKKEYGLQKIIDIKKLEINDRDRIGIVGRNGVGKAGLIIWIKRKDRLNYPTFQ